MSVSSSSTASSNVDAPSLTWLKAHPITFIPSLMPKLPESSATSSMRDESAESFQQQQIWNVTSQDLSLLLRLPIIEFHSHLLFNKSLQRCIENILQYGAELWEQTGGDSLKKRTWRSKDEESEEEEKKESIPEESDDTPQLKQLRGIFKKVLLVYVRICSYDTPLTSNASSASTPSWLTPLYFTTSFASSPLFSAASILDLVSLYASFSRKSHRPLLQLILSRLNDRLSFAFSTGMTSSFAVLTQALHQQVKTLHTPFNNNTSHAKKARFTREELRQLVRNLSSILWSLYAICEIRPELVRILMVNVKSNPPSPATPSFLVLLSGLYSLTPLVVLQEAGLKYSDLSAQDDLMHLRRGCMRFLKLVHQKSLYPAMGIDVRRHPTNGHVQVQWHAPTPVAINKQSASSATVSSTIPPQPSVSSAADSFYSTLIELNQAVRTENKESFLFLPTPMKNLLSFTTGSVQNAFLKRYNEYYEVDAVIMFMLNAQARTHENNTPGQALGEDKLKKLLDVFQQIDPQLLKQRVGWPEPSNKASASSSSSMSIDSMEEHKGAPLNLGLTSMSRGSTGKHAVDMSLQVSSLHDLFPHFSTDYLAACLSEYNADVEQTTKAILEEKLPVYLQSIKDKGRYKAGDQMDSGKLKRPDGIMSRQSSTGSGMLDEPVDDDDESIANGSVAYDDDAAFEEFLKRTGRVSKSQLEAKNAAAKSSGGLVLNSFSKSEAALLSEKINASLQREYMDEYDDAFDAFESFAVDGATPLELEERAAGGGLYDKYTEGSTGGADADEPDGNAYQRKMTKNAPAAGGAAARGGSGRDGNKPRGPAAGGYENIQVPRTFMPDDSASSNPIDQWRRDEYRKELYVAMIKAQKVQTIAPSKRTKEQQDDLDFALKQNLVQPIDGPSSQKQTQQQSQQQNQSQKQQGGGRQQQQQQSQQSQQPQQQGGRRQDSQQQSNRGGDSDRPARGGFSMRGGRGGSALSASAASFEPRSSAASSSSSQPPATNRSQKPKAAWDDESDDDNANVPAAGNTGHHQQSGGGGGDDDDDEEDEESEDQRQQRGGQHAKGGQQSQPMDLRAKKRKEKNKSVIGNHNRKAGALRKQGIKF